MQKLKDDFCQTSEQLNLVSEIDFKGLVSHLFQLYRVSQNGIRFFFL